MTAALKRMTSAEYLALERVAERKHEFVDGQLIAMAGASPFHNLINDNLVRHIGNALEGSRCRTLSRDMRVKCEETDSYFYPDLIIVCGKLDFEDDDLLVNLAVIFEILSKSSHGHDRVLKYHYYRMIPSLKEYVIVSQTEPMIERYIHQTDDYWKHDGVLGLESIMSLTSVTCSVPLKLIYRDVFDS